MQIYISKNNQQLGPFDEQIVMAMLRNGQLSPNDMAFQSGQANWQPLNSIFPSAGQMMPMRFSQKLALPNTLGNSPKMNKRRLLGLYFVSLIIVAVGIFAVVLGLMTANDNISPGVTIAAFVIAVLAYLQFLVVHTVLTFYILFKMWSSIQDGVSITTGKAIGFLFIPVFGVYWFFVAWGGFPNEYNSFVDRHQLKIPRLENGAYIFFPIIALVTGLLVFPILALPFVFMAVISQTCDAVNRLDKAIRNKRDGIQTDFTFEDEKTPLLTTPMRLAVFGVGGIMFLALVGFIGFVTWNKNPSPSKDDVPDTVGIFQKSKDLKSTGSYLGFRKEFIAMYEQHFSHHKQPFFY